MQIFEMLRKLRDIGCRMSFTVSLNPAGAFSMKVFAISDNENIKPLLETSLNGDPHVAFKVCENSFNEWYDKYIEKRGVKNGRDH